MANHEPGPTRFRAGGLKTNRATLNVPANPRGNVFGFQRIKAGKRY